MADANRFPTAQEVVDQADLLSPNQYSQEQKLQWLGELEGRPHLFFLFDAGGWPLVQRAEGGPRR